MRKINRYVGKTVFLAVLMVLLVILALDLAGTFIDEMGSLREDYNVIEALIYILLTLPGRTYQYLPYASLVGCLVGLGILANASELVVIRAAGVSVKRICWMVIKPVLFFVALGIALGEYVIPYTDQLADSRRAVALGDQRSVQTQRGLWTREGNDFIYFGAVQPDGVIHGVTRYRFDENQRLLQASYTSEASYQGGYWREEDISITHLEHESVRADRQDERQWDTDLSPALLNIVALEPHALSIRNLFFYSNYLGQQGLQNSEYRLAFWEKALQPLATISLVLIAISFIFGPLREVTMGQRIFTGVVFGIVFRLTQSLLGPSSLVFGFPPVIAVVIPIAGCFGLGFYLLNRTR
jgi:lipopolysaccharide export system permease protein